MILFVFDVWRNDFGEFFLIYSVYFLRSKIERERNRLRITLGIGARHATNAKLNFSKGP